MLNGVDTLVPAMFPWFFVCIATVSISKKSVQAFATIGMMSSVGLLLLGLTRASLISTFCGCVISILILAWRGNVCIRKRTLLFVFIILLMALLFVSWFMISMSGANAIDAVIDRFSGDYERGGGFGGLEYRLREADAVWACLRENPWTGQGFGGLYQFQDAGYEYVRDLSWAHGGWVWLALKTGLIGIMLFLCPFIIRLFQIGASPDLGWLRNLRAGVFSSCIVLAMESFSRNPFASVEGGAIIGLLLALSSLKCEKASADSRFLETKRLPQTKARSTGDLSFKRFTCERGVGNP
jgi:hypothetical protein